MAADTACLAMAYQWLLKANENWRQQLGSLLYSGAMPNLVFKQVLSELAPEAHNFHKGKLTEYLFPRSEEDFRRLADDESLYAAFDTDADNKMIGVALVDEATELDGKTRRWEFGGVFVEEEYRQYGVGTALGVISISNHLVWNATGDEARLISHVHEFNPLPRRMMTEHLGFVQDGEESPPFEPPASMKRNADGKVVGHLFVFQNHELARFADFIERWYGTRVILGKGGVESRADIQLPGFNDSMLQRTLATLRDLAANR